MADQYRLSVSTIRRWRFRDDVQERPHPRHNLLTILTPGHDLSATLYPPRTRWVYLEVRKSQSAKDAQGFLQNLKAKAKHLSISRSF